MLWKSFPCKPVCRGRGLPQNLSPARLKRAFCLKLGVEFPICYLVYLMVHN